MAIEFFCRCGENFRFSDSLAGNIGRCSSCNAVIQIPIPAFVPNEPGQSDASQAAATKLGMAQATPQVKAVTRTGNALEQSRATILVFAIMSLGAIGFVVAYLTYINQPKNPAKTVTTRPKPNVPKKPEPQKPSALAGLDPAEPWSIGKSVVNPSIAKPPEKPAEPKPMTSDQIVAKLESSVAVIRGLESEGSGFVVGPGFVATSAHLIRRSLPTAISVSFPAAPPGRQGPFHPDVLYFDDDRNLAILGVPAAFSPPIPLAADYTLRRGEDVVYLGGPRLNDPAKHCLAERGKLETEIRIDDREYYELSGHAAPSHSGAPVIDDQGRVVAIFSSKGPGEGGFLCIPGSKLVDAVKVVTERNTAREIETKKRHEASVRLSSIVVRNRNGVTVNGGGDKYLNDFLNKTGPATWLASIDANWFFTNSTPAVTPVRNCLYQVKKLYTVDGDKSIAASTIQFVGEIRNAGMPASCASFLDAAMKWVPGAVLKDQNPPSIQAFGNSYVFFRVNERLGHAEALARMQANQAAPGPAKPGSGNPKENGPNPADALFVDARRLEDEGKTESAIKAYESILKKFPKTPASGRAEQRLNILRPKQTPPAKSNSGRSMPRG